MSKNENFIAGSIESIFLISHAMLILSTVCSIGIDFFNKGPPWNIEYYDSDHSVLWHSIRFFVWQIIHYFIGHSLFSMKPYSIPGRAISASLEILQTVLVFIHHNNFWTKRAKEAASRVFIALEYTMISLQYSFYFFIAISILISILLIFSVFSSVKKERELNKKDSKIKQFENYEWIVTFLIASQMIMLGIFFFVDIYIIFNKENHRRETAHTGFLLLYSTVFVIYQFISLLASLCPITIMESHANCVQRAFLQQLCTIIYLFNPLIVVLRDEYPTAFDEFYYISIYENIGIPLFLITIMIQCDLNCKKRVICDDGKFVDKMIYHQNTSKWRGRYFKEWKDIISYFHIFSFTVFPIVWLIEVYLSETESIEELMDSMLELNLSKSSFLAVSQSLVLFLMQTGHFLVFYFTANSSFSFILVLIFEVYTSFSLVLFLIYWINPLFELFYTTFQYVLSYYPYTAISLAISFLIFIGIMIFVLVFTCQVDAFDEDEMDKYEVLDGEDESSTKMEDFKHPIYGIRNRN